MRTLLALRSNVATTNAEVVPKFRSPKARFRSGVPRGITNGNLNRSWRLIRHEPGHSSSRRRRGHFYRRRNLCFYIGRLVHCFGDTSGEDGDPGVSGGGSLRRRYGSHSSPGRARDRRLSLLSLTKTSRIREPSAPPRVRYTRMREVKAGRVISLDPLSGERYGRKQRFPYSRKG